MQSRIRRIAMAVGLVGALGLAMPVEAGIGVVTVNRHGPNEVNEHGDCTYCPDGSSFCPQGCPDDGPPDCRYDHPADFNNGSEALPYPATSTEWPEIDGFSHHVNPWRPSTGSSDWRRWRGRFCQAIAEYSPSGRPKILSTDTAGVEVKHDGDGTDVAFYLGLVCGDATVFLDGDTTGLVDVPITMDSGSWPFDEVGFSGSVGPGSYPPGTHQVDNFEASYICLTCDAAAGDDPGPVEQDSGEGV